MLSDRKRLVKKLARDSRLREEIVHAYGNFLRTLFSAGDWVVTLTFRDCHQDSELGTEAARENSTKQNRKRLPQKNYKKTVTKCEPDPRLADWEPDSKNRRESSPPVRDAALREIEHWLLELGWETAGRKRQEIFDHLADGLSGRERRSFAKTVCRKCLCCALLDDPVTLSFFYDVRTIATATIGWVIAEEFGRVGGRWHVHLLVRGVQSVRRKRWWKRAFTRFGRSRILPIHE
ncbi:MAG: hypothetical protein WA674_07515 [Candidatus Acidiferrales bacterium]